jgi:DNA-binding response OmpR family regulator
MSVVKASILIFDYTINTILKTVDVVIATYEKVNVVNTEAEAISYIENNAVDVLLLNLDLGMNDAVTFIKELSQYKLLSKPFIVIYSHKQDDFIQELAFNSGVDAFVNFHTKPSILTLFLNNLLSRRKKIITPNTKEIAMDEERYAILKNGEPTYLPRKEFKVFKLLYTSPEKIFTKKEIALLIWNDEAIAHKRTIDVHIYNIRQVFGKRVIQSQKGIGYRINKKLI